MNDNEYKTCPDCCYDILDDEGDVMDHECISDNEMIAEFMGVVFHDDENQYYNADGLHIGNTLQYHTSWDWLIPVLIKIERIILGEVTWISTYCDIEREYKRAVEWIRKYNDNPKHMTLQ